MALLSCEGLKSLARVEIAKLSRLPDQLKRWEVLPFLAPCLAIALELIKAVHRNVELVYLLSAVPSLWLSVFIEGRWFYWMARE